MDSKSKSDFWVPIGRQRLTVSTAVVTLTPTSGANVAYITVEAQPLRYTLDGTNPVAATTGHLTLAAAVIRLYSSGQLSGFKAIRDGVTDAVLEITYGRTP